MSDISVYVLKQFPYSRDGITEEFAEVKKTIDIPGRLFNGLNKEGYVRRAVIGDGHVTLRQPTINEQRSASGLPSLHVDLRTAKDIAPVVPVSDDIHETTETNSGAAAEIIKTAAPQPPVKTSGLTDSEQATLADDSWRALKFFAKRSIAAKLSDQPITDGASADAAIEVYIAAQKD